MSAVDMEPKDFMENVEIVKLSPDNWQDYKNLRLKALQADPDAFGLTYGEAIVQPDEKWRIPLELAQRGQEKWLLFARVNGALVGMISGTAMTNEDEKGNVKIKEMFVSSEVRGKGIAGKLITSLEEELKVTDMTGLRLGVFTNQTTAIHVYEKLGFRILETIPETLPNGITHETHYMGKDL